MKIREILSKGEPTLSFEVFPPKTEDRYESVEHAAIEIAKLKPAFMSVTYGAGGGTSRYTVDIAATVQAQGVTPLAHLTCVSSTREKVVSVLEELKARGIENVLALRGDIPGDGQVEKDYYYASELIGEIRRIGDFCIGAACYPEGHVESVNKAQDIHYLKEKVEAGCDFVTTQMFFDNNVYYNFLYRTLSAGIQVPIIPGIMPIINANQVRRSQELSGATMPPRFLAIADKFAENPLAMEQAGIAYATDQIVDLVANGVKHIHLYTMNRPQTAERILANLSHIVR